MTNNFFKIAGVGLAADPFNFFPFDDRDFLSTIDAYNLAENRRATYAKECPEARIAVHRQPKSHGMWRLVSEIGEGIDGIEAEDVDLGGVDDEDV